jgi:hypothetical protein
MIQRISDLIMQNRHVVVEELQAQTVHSIIRDDLKMRKLLSQWVGSPRPDSATEAGPD